MPLPNSHALQQPFQGPDDVAGNAIFWGGVSSWVFFLIKQTHLPVGQLSVGETHFSNRFL